MLGQAPSVSLWLSRPRTQPTVHFICDGCSEILSHLPASHLRVGDTASAGASDSDALFMRCTAIAPVVEWVGERWTMTVSEERLRKTPGLVVVFLRPPPPLPFALLTC